MAFSSHHKEGGSGSDLVEDTQDQNSTKCILGEKGTAEELEEPTEEGSKIHRTRFTALQKIGLEEAFAACQYVRSHDCHVLAERLGLSVKTVQVWFRNKRFKIRMSARQERQRHRLQPSASNCSFRSTKPHEVAGSSLPTYTFADSTIPYVLHSPPLVMYTDDYLVPPGYSSAFTAVTSAQTRYMHHRSHPYQ